ncbi:hypothetical protein MtrunA17_Chr3g0127041 [Medicago truncatula]|uniref:Uncharacterized protein n=1 Tax=Medicago truncatula TaxID=3880 RepID=A0A396IW33_MEDTR|nr:hypothetical protein MtrunA17_Chr3g0127041 [Medicago truncatula]
MLFNLWLLVVPQKGMFEFIVDLIDLCLNYLKKEKINRIFCKTKLSLMQLLDS